MKIFIPRIPWVVDFHKFFVKAFEGNKVEVASNEHDFELSKTLHFFKLQQITKIRNLELRYQLKKYNATILNDCINFKPDVFLEFNESYLYPETISAIKERCKCTMVCVLGDDPWDSSRWVADFPHSLRYFDFIFNPEVIWNVNLRKVAPNALIYWHHGGYDPNYYYPVPENLITLSDREQFSCELSFTGTSYGNKAEGAYRSDILSYVSDFDLKIWGDNNWPYRFRYHPELKPQYKGGRLPMDDLLKLYTLSKINLNLPAPQLATCFQPRVFEIAATKGFQIIDYRSSLKKLFSSDDIVTFNTIPELRDKTRYYIDHDKERTEMAEQLYQRVTQRFTWTYWAKCIIKTIESPKDYELLEDEF
jgi:spore maturation protein CgeB